MKKIPFIRFNALLVVSLIAGFSASCVYAEEADATERSCKINCGISNQCKPNPCDPCDNICKVGPQGKRGKRGHKGAAGATGATGSAGAALNFAYVYNTSIQTVDVESDCTFDHNGIISAGITHTVGTAQINIGNSGIYSVIFSVAGDFSNQFALAVNGTPVAASIFGVDEGDFEGPNFIIPNTGFAILALTAGDVLTLRNHTSTEFIPLPLQVGGTQFAVNAAMLIKRLA